MTPDLTHPDLEKDAELRALAKGGDMTPLEILKQARELISVPERWTQNAWAADEEGNGLTWGYNPMAVCWCADGAIEYVVGEKGIGSLAQEEADLELLMAIDCEMPVAKFNDTHTHAEVLSAFDRAIAAAEVSP